MINDFTWPKIISLTIKGNNECSSWSDRKFMLFNCVKYCYCEGKYLEGRYWEGHQHPQATSKWDNNLITNN